MFRYQFFTNVWCEPETSPKTVLRHNLECDGVENTCSAIDSILINFLFPSYSFIKLRTFIRNLQVSQLNSMVFFLPFCFDSSVWLGFLFFGSILVRMFLSTLQVNMVFVQSFQKKNPKGKKTVWIIRGYNFATKPTILNSFYTRMFFVPGHWSYRKRIIGLIVPKRYVLVCYSSISFTFILIICWIFSRLILIQTCIVAFLSKNNGNEHQLDEKSRKKCTKLKRCQLAL